MSRESYHDNNNWEKSLLRSILSSQQQWDDVFQGSCVKKVPSKEEMMELIPRCRECDRIPPPNYLTCERGHVSCVKCGDSRNYCIALGTDKLNPLTPCLKPLEKKPCFVYTTIFNLCKIQCQNKLCSEIVPGANWFSHDLKCIGRENLKCPATECLDEGPFTVISFMDHINDIHNPISHGDLQLHLVSEHWWFEQDCATIPFIVQFDGDSWIGVSVRKKWKNKDSCIFTMLSTSNSEGRTAKPTSETRFRTTLTFLGEHRRRRNWEGILPCVNESLEEALETNRCLIIPGIEPKEIQFLQIKFTGFHNKEPSRLPALNWRNVRNTHARENSS